MVGLRSSIKIFPCTIYSNRTATPLRLNSPTCSILRPLGIRINWGTFCTECGKRWASCVVCCGVPIPLGGATWIVVLLGFLYTVWHTFKQLLSAEPRGAPSFDLP
ncbi:unnamed protein product [Musa acuminata subsp. malaccensis]|uniref:(wild Malaysian banana) hypothetical protein n=1 Tax=Musa acuminata subsp. malaccensis TaxID=214687 RepID=A0A804JJV5_MUSAM|nr:unnamed protein product [Musa acuminata subsp. malaccensis]